MPAIDVFTHSIKYLKDEFLTELKNRNVHMTFSPSNETVTWVLTVPAIWDEPEKQLMEEAAELVIDRKSVV